eukprot:930210-Pyramimonas_sp.AAC.1
MAQENGPVIVALGYEPGCSSLEVTRALNSCLEISSERLALAVFPAGAAEERARGDMGAII